LWPPFCVFAVNSSRKEQSHHVHSLRPLSSRICAHRRHPSLLRDAWRQRLQLLSSKSFRPLFRAQGPGLTSPSLKRLERAGLVISTPGPRNRLRYAVTDLGAHLLRESLRPDEPNCWKAGKRTYSSRCRVESSWHGSIPASTKLAAASQGRRDPVGRHSEATARG